MQLNFTECQATGSNILKDLGNYNRVPDYLTALVNATETGDHDVLSFMPLDCGYILSGEIKWVIHGGYVSPDARANIEFLSKKPGWVTIMLNDHLCINADAFEQELFFKWE